ncbi:hypothetical protein A3J41_01190 [candidate division TM6 bacterium RIFCSPHIGHO2_12_FULL_38_8]|nr:MAG: hypothetical protein A3J41_01190 [candidate division TM6 bacterium RIFCSPHIGHO2_12_FULL_38_8]
MKQSKILLFCVLLGGIGLLHADPLLVAVLMVRNEAPVMEMTLQPLINAGIKDFLIYDTGSTDKTIPIIRGVFLKNRIRNFVIEQGEFIDFATSRNKALELTELHFPNATFMLMLDAEWILHNGKALLRCCEQEKNNSPTLYFIKLTSNKTNFYHPRLIRCKSNISFVGKVHEIPNIEPQGKIYDHIYFEYNPTDYGQEKTKTRWLRDCSLLEQELEIDPDNSRSTFFLAKTYFALGDMQNAIKWGEKRIVMQGWAEETFLTYLLLAQAYQACNDSERMLINYFTAFNLRPHRADPLIQLAEYYYSIGAYELCYLFARHATAIPYPTEEIAAVDQSLYDYTRYALLSATAHHVGDFELGKQATLKVIQAHPDQKYLYKNLEYYLNQLGECENLTT